MIENKGTRDHLKIFEKQLDKRRKECDELLKKLIKLERTSVRLDNFENVRE